MVAHQGLVGEQVRGEGALPSVAVEQPPAGAGPGMYFQKTAQVNFLHALASYLKQQPLVQLFQP